MQSHVCFQGLFPCTQTQLILVTWHNHVVHQLIISPGNIFEDLMWGHKCKPAGKVILSDSGDDTASNNNNESIPTDIEHEFDRDLDMTLTTENYKNMKVLGNKDCKVTEFYLLNENLHNIVHRWKLKAQKLSGLLTFVLSLNVMTMASTQTWRGLKVCSSQFEPILWLDWTSWTGPPKSSPIFSKLMELDLWTGCRLSRFA